MRSGVTTSTLWRKETGGTEFKASELVRIAKACGVDLGQLVAVQMPNQANTGPAEAASGPQG